MRAEAEPVVVGDAINGYGDPSIQRYGHKPSVAVREDAVLESCLGNEASVHRGMAELASVEGRGFFVVAHQTGMGAMVVDRVSVEELRVGCLNAHASTAFREADPVAFAGIGLGAVAVAVRVAAPRVVADRGEHHRIGKRAVRNELAVNDESVVRISVIEREFHDRARLDGECRTRLDRAPALDFIHLAAGPRRVVRDRAVDDDAAHDAWNFLGFADRAV